MMRDGTGGSCTRYFPSPSGVHSARTSLCTLDPCREHDGRGLSGVTPALHFLCGKWLFSRLH